jgi:PLP dependent protein
MSDRDLQVNYKHILNLIERSARSVRRQPKDITLVAVSKKQSIEKIEALYHLGQRDFGENYVQELVEKAKLAEARGLGEIRWHFIGHLQTNKVKALLPHIHTLHSVNSVRLSQSLAKSWTAIGKSSPLPVFIEVDLSGEVSKSGVALSDLTEVVTSLGSLPNLALQGLMCIPSPLETPHGLASKFKELKDIEGELGSHSSRKLSMGMSSDFEIAIAQGATHVRIGTSIFGVRDVG